MPGTALVTGTSSGIGLSTAVLLAEAGFEVVATMRDLEKATPLRERANRAGVTLDVRALDVQDDVSIRACVDGVREAHDGIALLVNNAGAGFLGTLEQTSKEDVRRLQSYLSGTREAFANAGQTGDDIGRVIVEAATADEPHLRYVTSELVQDLAARKYVDTTGGTIVALTGARLP